MKIGKETRSFEYFVEVIGVYTIQTALHFGVEYMGLEYRCCG
jgi:hypothetical protein